MIYMSNFSFNYLVYCQNYVAPSNDLALHHPLLRGHINLMNVDWGYVIVAKSMLQRL